MQPARRGECAPIVHSRRRAEDCPPYQAGPAKGQRIQQTTQKLIRFELRLLRRKFFVGSFGAYIVTKVANAGLCDDQFAAREF
jgi:hypothetical protein